MSSFRKIADRIPGLLAVGLIFRGSTPSGDKVSMAVLIDGDTEVVLDLGQGLGANDPRLTKPMKSYLTGLAEVGSYLKARKTEDEDGVTEDDIERAALVLAFPKVAQNGAALTILKSHLDALQAEEIIEKIGAGAAAPARARPAAAPNAAAKPAAPVAKPAPKPAAAPVAAAASAAAVTAAVSDEPEASADEAKADDAKADSIADKVKAAMTDAKDDVADKVEEVKSDAEDTVENIAQMAEDKVDDVKEAIADVTEDVKEAAADAISEATPKTDAADAAAAVVQSGQDKPNAPRRGFFRS